MFGNHPKFNVDISDPGSYLKTSSKCGHGDRAFAKPGPDLWNRLPLNIRCLKTLESFKSAIKTFLFKRAFGC